MTESSHPNQSSSRPCFAAGCRLLVCWSAGCWAGAIKTARGEWRVTSAGQLTNIRNVSWLCSKQLDVGKTTRTTRPPPLYGAIPWPLTLTYPHLRMTLWTIACKSDCLTVGIHHYGALKCSQIALCPVSVKYRVFFYVANGITIRNPRNCKLECSMWTRCGPNFTFFASHILNTLSTFVF